MNAWTPLHVACYHGHVDVVKVLLKHSANVHAKTRNGELTPEQVCRKDLSESVRSEIHAALANAVST